MTRFEKWSLLVTSIATALTGLGYLWIKYLMESTDPWAVFNHPLQPWFLKAHILVSPLLLFAVGGIAVRHIWRHFRARIQAGRRSGIAVALSLTPMVLTGYLIQAVTHEAWLLGIAYTHIGVSVVYTLGLAVHYVLARRAVHLHGAAVYRRTRRIEGRRSRKRELQH